MGRPKGLPKTGGRTKGARNAATADVKALASQYGAQAVAALAEIATSPDQPASARVSAANSLLDRGYGKPNQAVELTGKDGAPLIPAKLDDMTDEQLAAIAAGGKASAGA